MSDEKKKQDGPIERREIIGMSRDELRNLEKSGERFMEAHWKEHEKFIKNEGMMPPAKSDGSPPW